MVADFSEASTSLRKSGSVAIMQPYFAPYPGYFRLFAATEMFVIFDCVQFPRRGWVHRNQFRGSDGVLRTLTLPLRKGPQEMLIRDLEFAPGATSYMESQVRRFPALNDHIGVVSSFRKALLQANCAPVDYLENLLKMVCECLGLVFNTIRSSSLRLEPELRNQARIIEIMRRVGGHHYVNAPGGRELYEEASFVEAGLTLSFLPEYRGPQGSVLQRLFSEGVDAVARDVRSQTTLLKKVEAR